MILRMVSDNLGECETELAHTNDDVSQDPHDILLFLTVSPVKVIAGATLQPFHALLVSISKVLAGSA